MNTLVLPADSQAAIAQAARTLLSGGLVAFPTDTVYGIGAHAFDAAAVERLYVAKERPQDKAIPVLLADAIDLPLVARQIPPTADRLAEALLRNPPWLMAGSITFSVISSSGSR